MSNTAKHPPYEILPEAPQYDWDTIQAKFESDDFINVRNILPYRKMPTVLSYEKLRDLLREARACVWKVLDLSDYALKEIPDEIGDLTDLEILILENKTVPYANSFTQLPNSIGNLRSLKVLSVRNAPLTRIPPSLGKLEQLQYLDISGNKKFAAFPEIIYKLKKLRVLQISYTTVLGKTIEPYAIPELLAELSSLERLHIAGRGFNGLPNAIGRLPHLRTLSVSMTKIESIPEAISNSRSLKKLALSDNLINRLPDSIGDIASLESLSLVGEQIDSIPRSMTKLENLYEFNFGFTPLFTKVPPNKLNQSPQEIIRFLLGSTDEMDRSVPHESKLLILGETGVGKTSLANRLIFNKFVQAPTTVGIDVHEWDITSTGKEDDKDTKIVLWDFGGDAIYHATHHHFLSDRSLYMLVWDAQKDMDYGQVEYWLETINTYAKGSPVFIVANKCDGDFSKPRINLEMYRKTYKNLTLVDSYEVSCLSDGAGIVELSKAIVASARELPLIHDNEWPVGWVKVRKHLWENYNSSMRYILHDDYMNIYDFNNASINNQADNLLAELHKLGIILYFPKYADLKDLIFLEIKWGTEGVYKILKCRSHKNGIIENNALFDILDNHDMYPKESHEYIKLLMFRFGLAFGIPNQEKFCVPELLPYRSDDSPIEGFSGDTYLHWRFEYPFLPTGLMSRFIVKLQDHLLNVKGKYLCWSDEAYLGYGKDCKAKIALVDTRRRSGSIDLMIWCKDPAKVSEVLNEVRSCLFAINSFIPKLICNELVRCNHTPACKHFYSVNTLRLYLDNEMELTVCEDTGSKVEIHSLFKAAGGLEKIVNQTVRP